jgi:molybdopterin synthase catalytic subunit
VGVVEEMGVMAAADRFSIRFLCPLCGRECYQEARASIEMLACVVAYFRSSVHRARATHSGYNGPMIRLTTEAIDYHALTEQVRRNDCGAVVTFLGTVRELTAGRVTIALDYEAYPGMAEKKMAEIERETRARWPVGEIALVHRLGHLELGDVSVAVAVSCPHRAQAFEACRYAIDRLKEVVPIWKKENWADGSTEWVHPGTETQAS